MNKRDWAIVLPVLSFAMSLCIVVVGQGGLCSNEAILTSVLALLGLATGFLGAGIACQIEANRSMWAVAVTLPSLAALIFVYVLLRASIWDLALMIDGLSKRISDSL